MRLPYVLRRMLFPKQWRETLTDGRADGTREVLEDAIASQSQGGVQAESGAAGPAKVLPDKSG